MAVTHIAMIAVILYSIFMTGFSIDQNDYRHFGQMCAATDSDSNIDSVQYFQTTVTGQQLPSYVWPPRPLCTFPHPAPYCSGGNGNATIIPIDCDNISKQFSEKEQRLLFRVMADINRFSKCVMFKDYVKKNGPFVYGLQIDKSKKRECGVHKRGVINADKAFMSLHEICFLETTKEETERFEKANNANYELILHEFMHVLGFNHEQRRYDRDQYIDVYDDNIEPKDLLQYKLTPHHYTDVGPYRLSSVMQYGMLAATKNGNLTWNTKKTQTKPPKHESPKTLEEMSRYAGDFGFWAWLRRFDYVDYLLMDTWKLEFNAINKFDLEKIDMVYKCEDGTKQDFEGKFKDWYVKVCEL